LGKRSKLPEGGGDYYPVESYEEVFDLLIEARDPVTGDLIASRQEDWMPGHAPSGLVVHYQETDLGAVVLVVYQPTLIKE